MADTPINDVSDTALWVATYRAYESERGDALFRDPFAAKLAGEKGKSIAARMMGAKYTSWSVVIRTVVIDKYITELVNAGVDTVVNLGAGLDTRPYRMNLPESLNWIEADHPHMIAMKEEKLSSERPKCKLARYKVDLGDDKARKSFLEKIAGEAKKAVILTEGVVPYLSQEQVAALARDLHAHLSFKYWICDYFSPQVIRFMTRGKRRKMMRNAPFLFNPSDYYGFFLQNGWKEKETRFLGVESKRLGRNIPMPWWAQIFFFFFPPKNDDIRLRFSGYILLEPTLIKL